MMRTHILRPTSALLLINNHLQPVQPPAPISPYFQAMSTHFCFLIIIGNLLLREEFFSFTVTYSPPPPRIIPIQSLLRRPIVVPYVITT